jgi:hypothetical protein
MIKSCFANIKNTSQHIITILLPGSGKQARYFMDKRYIGKIRSVTTFIPKNSGYKHQHKTDEWTWSTLRAKPMAPIQ